MSLSRLFLATAILAAPTAAAEAATASSPITLEATLSQSVMPAGKRQSVYLRIGIKSDSSARLNDRAPLNIALVIDRSGSMSGRKMEEARKAALLAVERLGPRDVISVVSYDNVVEVEVPATRAGANAHINRKIKALTARGSTAIHAGLIAGAEEVRKFKSRDYVNRIILLSDGLANVGPRLPADFEALGRELGSEGIVVSTIGLGLGYNEDLMAGLAKAADGNHAFVQEPEDLANFFNKEFDDAQNILAQNIEIIIECESGVTIKRSLGRSATNENNRMTYKLGQLIAGTEQAILTELETPAMEANAGARIATVRLVYHATHTNMRHDLTTAIEARASANQSEVEASHRQEVIGDATLLEARARKDEAIRLRDRGLYEEAKRKFKENAASIQSQAARYGFSPSPALKAEQEANEKAASLDDRDSRDWQQQRKEMRQQDGNVSGAKFRY